MLLNLQLFADEGSTQFATGTESVDEGSTTEVDTATAEESVEDAKPTFKELIKGDYKDDYQKELQKALDKRFKNQQDLQGQLDRVSPILDMIGSKYGIARTDQGYDIEAIQRKLEEDNSLYEQEAFERGIDVDTLKQIKQLERKNESLQRQQREAENRRNYERLVQQANEAREIYPNFDLETEMSNDYFMRLIYNGVDARTAYEVIHKDELMTQGMQYAVQKTKENISRDIQSGKRPIENGTSSSSSSSVGAADVTKFDKKQFDEIKRRAENGERIVF